jgi:hypothetical protein
MILINEDLMRAIDFLFLCSPKNFGGAYSLRLVPPLSCPEHNLKTLGDNLFKLHTVVEGIEGECSVKEP